MQEGGLFFCKRRGTRMDASPYYIRMRVPAWLFGSGASPVTTLYPACGGSSCNAQRRKDYPTQARARKWVIRDARRMCAYMENTVYAIRCVCLYILCSGGHTGFVSLFIQDKNRERSEHKQAARETSTLLWGKEKSTNKDRER